jgi:hypothetical protein
MASLQQSLEAHRRRIRARRALESAARGAFYAALAGAAALLARNLLGLPFPAALAAALLVAVPAGAALRAWARRWSLRDCAVHLDRLLGLEERLATAVEGAGALGPAVEADAARALGRAAFPRRPAGLEARLLVPVLVVLGAVSLVPPAERAVGGDRVLDAVLAAESARLAEFAAAEIRFREVADLLAQGRAEEALAVLQALRETLERRLLEGAPGGEGLRRQAEQAAASAAAVSAELARMGRTVHAPPPRIAEAKLRRQAEVAAAVDADADAGGAARAGGYVPRKDWDPRYDAVITRYFGSRP